MENRGYSWEEQERFWTQRYELLSEESGIPIDLIIESRRQILVAFGQKWLRREHEASRKKGKKLLLEILAPSIVGLVTNPIVNSAVQLVELAKYLSALKDQPKLDTVLTMLKNKDQFESTRLTVAMAYRFQKVGFEQVLLEPDVPRGRGDFQGMFLGQNFLVECSMLREDNIEQKFSDQLTSRLERTIKDQLLNVGIEVEFNSKVNPKSLDETIEKIREARHTFGRQKDPTNLEDVQFKSSVSTGRIFKLSDQQRKETPDLKKWDFVIGLTHTVPKEAGNVYSIEIGSQTRTGMIFVKELWPEREQKSLYERVKEKIETKVVQTHGVDPATKRIFVVMSERPVEHSDWNQIWKSILPSIKIRPSITGMWFVDRRTTNLDGKLRYAYPQILFQNPYQNTPQLAELFPKLEALERSDWIGSI